MTIAGVDCGYRSGENAVSKPKRWFSMAVSQAAQITVGDFGTKEFDVPIAFNLMDATTMAALRTALFDTVMPGHSCTLALDSGDDLGVDAVDTVDMYFMDFAAQWVAGDKWRVEVLFKYFL